MRIFAHEINIHLYEMSDTSSHIQLPLYTTCRICLWDNNTDGIASLTAGVTWVSKIKKWCLLRNINLMKSCVLFRVIHHILTNVRYLGDLTICIRIYKINQDYRVNWPIGWISGVLLTWYILLWYSKPTAIPVLTTYWHLYHKPYNFAIDCYPNHIGLYFDCGELGNIKFNASAGIKSSEVWKKCHWM